MELKFTAGDYVKIPGLSRPCQVLCARTEDRRFRDRNDLEGKRVALAEPHYSVQIAESSSTRFVAESKMQLIAPADVEGELRLADPLPTGAAQNIAGGNQPRSKARVDSDARALREEKARLEAELEERRLKDEVAELKQKLAMKVEPGAPVQ